MECSGRGVKLQNGDCECFGDWTSFGDLRMQTHADCDVSTIFVRVVYIVPVLVLIYIIYHAITEISRMVQSKGWQRLLFTFNRFKVLLIQICAILSSIFLIAGNLLKIAEPSRALGIDEALSLLYLVGVTFMFVIIGLAYDLMVTFSIKQERFGGNRSFLRLLFFTKLFMPYLSVVMYIAYVLVVAAVYERQQSISEAERYIKLFYLMVGGMSVVLVIAAPLTFHSACRDLDAMLKRHKDQTGASDKEISWISTTLKLVRFQVVLRGSINAVTFLVFGLSEDARYWGPYFIGLTVMMLPNVIWALSSLTPAKRTHGSSSSRDSKTIQAAGSKLQISDNSKHDLSTMRTSKDDLPVTGSSVVVFTGTDGPIITTSSSNPAFA